MTNKYIVAAFVAVLANLSATWGVFLSCLLTLCFMCSLGFLYYSQYISKITLLLFAVVWLMSSGLRLYSDTNNSSEFRSEMNNTNIQVQGAVYSAPERDGDRVQFELMISRYVYEEIEYTSREKILVNLYLTKHSEIALAEQFHRGQFIQLQGELKQPQSAQNYEQFDYQRYLFRNGIHWTMQLSGINNISIIGKEDRILLILLHKLDKLKKHLFEPFSKLFTNDEAGYLGGLVFGMKDNLSPELFSSFSKLGLTHILAVSGLHVAVVVVSLLFLLRLCRIPQSISYSITICILPLYMLITGGEPSIIRAGSMGMIGLWLMKKQKLKNTTTILAITFIGMLLINPLVIYNIGFQLSFIVTYGLIVFTPLVRQSLTSRKGRLYDMAAITISAQLTSFPLSIFYFNTFNPLSLIANFLLVPYISFVILPLATLANIVGHFSIALAKPLAVMTHYGNEASFFIIDSLNALKIFNMHWRSPSLLWIMIWFLLIYITLSISVSYQLSKRFSAVKYTDSFSFKHLVIARNALIVGIILSLLFTYIPINQLMLREGSVSFISVGQGDSILVKTPSNKYMLIDSGGQIPFVEKEAWAIRAQPFDVGRNILLPLLKKRGVQKLDVVVITHFDVDHFQGLLALMDEIRIDEIWLNGSIKDDSEVKKLLDNISEHRITVKSVKMGDQTKLDRFTTVDVLWPQSSINSSQQNEQSIVLNITMHDYTFLLTGDIGEVTERELVYRLYAEKGEGDAIDVLKLAHHGSRYSTSPSLLSYFQPKIAVVSVGVNNRYGHPHESVVNRLASYEIPLLRTDYDGEIIFKVRRHQMEMLRWKS